LSTILKTINWNDGILGLEDWGNGVMEKKEPG